MKKHRVAVVGCGALAQGAHLPSCQKNPRVELVATCDINREAAELCRNKFGAQRVETDWRRIVEAKDIDLCILCTHTNLRGQFIVPALESGKAVYTEKPLAPSRDDMIGIVKTARRTGRPVCVGHNRRSGPAVLEFKRLVEKAQASSGGTLPTVDRSSGGKRAPLPEQRPFQLLLRVNDDIRSWKSWAFWDAEGIIYAEMVHFVDLALWMNRGKPVRVFAEGSPRGNFTQILRFDDSSITTLQHSMVGNFDYPKELFEASVHNITVALEHHVEIRQVGMKDEPMIRFFPFGAGCEWAKKRGMTGYFQEIEAEHKRARQARRAPRTLGVDKGHYRHLDRFFDHLEGKGPNPCDIDSAVAVNLVTLKLLESARLGLPLAINPEDWHLPEE